jgi:hypothetical protein
MAANASASVMAGAYDERFSFVFFIAFCFFTSYVLVFFIDRYQTDRSWQLVISNNYCKP